MFTLKEDYQEAYTDGSGRYKKIFKAGDSIAWETAYALGLVTTKTEPKEEKRDTKHDVAALDQAAELFKKEETRAR